MSSRFLRLLVLVVLAGLSLWPLFVLASSILDWLFGSGRFTTQLELLPKKLVLTQFLQDYLHSAWICAALAMTLLLDYWLFARRAGLRKLFGLFFICCVVTLAVYFFADSPYAVFAAIIAALGTVIFAKLFLALFLKTPQPTLGSGAVPTTSARTESGLAK